jgi:ADP-ribose pyrophosphatase YjhB (NUDIX family)
MQLQVGVKIALKDKERRILLLRRSEKVYGEYKHMWKQWDLPGGRIEPGKSLKENLQRELKEELNFNWKGSPTLLAAQDIIMPDRHVVRLTYLDHLSKTPKIKLDNENTEYEWFSVKEMKSLGKGLDKFAKELLQNKQLT